ncbi:MAG: hypothetical protein JWM14_2996 [Chitinophagaceae bacterium]|nr:hypothetical protein [Chitinophagaceae bacterium]
MKLIYSSLLFFSTCTLLFAQQTFSSFPVAIDKAEYDDREAVFVTDENDETGVFLSDNNVIHFIKLDENGAPVEDLKQSMPLNYSSLKRAGVGTLGGSFFCYFTQGNKKIMVLQADLTAKKISYTPFPLPNDKDPILFVGAAAGYLYVVTSSGDVKNELTVYQYTAPSDPKVIKVKTQDADLYKTLSINTNKAIDQIAALPLNSTAHFTQTAQALKAYHDIDNLILTYDASEGETRILKALDESPKIIVVKSEQATEKKSVFKSILYNDKLYQLTVSAKGILVKGTKLSDVSSIAESPVIPDFYMESSYSARIGYSRERKAATEADLIKSFNRADFAGLGLLESSNGKLLLVAGLINKNNIADPSLDNTDSEQKGTLSVNMIMERNYPDLHLPSYTADQNALLKFKKEIWVYTYWTLDAETGNLSKALPEDVPALDESLDLFYRDPLNNVAPAVWKKDKTYLFGFYSSKNQLYTLYKIGGKPAGGNMNRR